VRRQRPRYGRPMRLPCISLALLIVVALLSLPRPVAAQGVPDGDPLRQWLPMIDTPAPTGTTFSRPRPHRIRLFRIEPGFLSDPVGLEPDDPNEVPPDDGPDWLQLAAGNDNPFFDFRRPGDPGGIGYFKVHGQVQLLD